MKPFYEWEYPWRPNYEAKMAAIWLGASVVTWLMAKTMPVPLPQKFSGMAMMACLLMAGYRGGAAYKRHKDMARMESNLMQFVTIPELVEQAEKANEKKSIWLGKGFDWHDEHAQKMHSLLSQGADKVISRIDTQRNGAYWLHGLDEEGNVHMEQSHLVGHTLFIGTTRVGKTRGMELSIAQAILRGEPVIIIDPKGDHELAANARRICEAMGQPERFVYFHPAHPKESMPIDPLSSFNRRTELASRVGALIPSETGADPFAAFGWKVLNDVVNGLVAIGKKPNLTQLKRYVESGADSLLKETLRHHFIENVKDWEKRSSSYLKKNKDSQLLGYIDFYKQIAIHEAQSTEIDGLISTYEHNRDHFQKMIASLIPILSMLTAEPLGHLLSPDQELISQGKATNMANIIRNGQVAYLGLDSLADGTVGAAIGSIMLADLTAVAGDRYNYGLSENQPVNLYIDEGSEVINKPTIQLMNKGGGAYFRVTIATQTLADFAARLGNENQARQVLANLNTQIIFRVLDADTQKYLSEGLPKIKYKTLGLSYGHGVDDQITDAYQSAYRENMTEEEASMFPPELFGSLPPLHFIAKVSGGRLIKGRIPILDGKGG